MLEINQDTRLVMYANKHWVAQRLVNTPSSHRRPIWKPITQLLSHSEAKHWLSVSNVPASIMALFNQIAI